MGKSVKFSATGIQQYLNAMIDRARIGTGWLNRYAYPRLIQMQRDRWQSEGASEGNAWQAIKPSYKAYKLRKFADYPGSGSKLLIATGRLVNSMTGDTKADHWKMVKGNELTMGSLVPYAKYVDEVRDITTIGNDTMDDLADSYVQYIMTGNVRR